MTTKPAGPDGGSSRIANVAIEGVSKSFVTFEVPCEVSVDIDHGEFVLLMGPSY
jgi:ABC-type Fe3+/spermidine/putrescine transport system ATPase subunit